MAGLIVHESDGVWEEAVPVSVGSRVQCSVAPPVGEELKDVVARMQGVNNDLPCPLPCSGVVEILE
uniref:Uncharacterized protein n=1 Tax=Anguilla anguilla TaxID=7936 RepID=A0A0E9WPM9_ANGAN